MYHAFTNLGWTHAFREDGASAYMSPNGRAEVIEHPRPSGSGLYMYEVKLDGVTTGRYRVAAYAYGEVLHALREA